MRVPVEGPPRPSRLREAGPAASPIADVQLVDEAPRRAPPTDSSDVAAPPSSTPDTGESPLRSAVSVVTTIGPPVTIATALMIYFGWARSDTQARAMGLDVSLFRFSAQDYVLQSISTLYVPLLIIAALALAGLALHWRVNHLLQRPSARPTIRTAGRTALTGGLIAAGAAVSIAWLDPGRAPLVVPLVLAAGVAVAAYGGWLARAARAADSRAPAVPLWQAALRVLLVWGVITLALFWEVSSFAGVVGRGYAQQIEASVHQLPRATALSTRPLGIEAPGVREERIAAGPAADSDAVRYRTTGLRLLANSGGRMFLLHDGWRPEDGTVIVLPDDGQIWWQFSR
jgi:hypothetical protein